jgi:hypothetical protein
VVLLPSARSANFLDCALPTLPARAPLTSSCHRPAGQWIGSAIGSNGLAAVTISLRHSGFRHRCHWFAYSVLVARLDLGRVEPVFRGRGGTPVRQGKNGDLQPLWCGTLTRLAGKTGKQKHPRIEIFSRIEIFWNARQTPETARGLVFVAEGCRAFQ